MSNSLLPYWYLHSKVKLSGELEEEQWGKLIDERILLLKEGDRKISELGLDLAEKHELALREKQAFTMMKVGVCLDPRLSSWLVETEGDLFEIEFKKLKWEEKEAILNDLFPITSGKPLWREIEVLSLELNLDIFSLLDLKKTSDQIIRADNPLYKKIVIKDTRGMNNFIGIDFRYATVLIKSRKVALYKGWAIGTVSRFLTTIKHTYQQLIENSLTDLAEKLDDPINIKMKAIAESVNEMLNTKVEFKRGSLKIGHIKLIGTIDENITILPPCIEDLLQSVNEVGYIGHWERLQLGIFLKQTGMNVDEQLEFWYNKAVDNINMSFDDFLSKAGYVIRHIYGLEGGKVDYQMPSCNTIQAKMYCTFRHSDIETINKRVTTKLEIFSTKKDDLASDKEQTVRLGLKKLHAKRVMDASSNGLPSLACAYHLEMMTGATSDNIYHPLYYLQRAGSRLGAFQKEDLGVNEDEKES